MFLVTRNAQGFSSYTISPWLEVHRPLDFNSWLVDSQLKEAFPSVTGASLPIMSGKQRLGVYLRGVWGLGAAGARSGGQPGLKGWPRALPSTAVV